MVTYRKAKFELTRLAVFVAVALAAIAAHTAEAAIEIAVRGKAPEYAIVVPEKASPVEKYAAEELQTFLKAVTGVTLPLASDAGDLPAKAILVGETRHSLAQIGGTFDPKSLGDDGFRIAARPPHLVVYGSSKRGALYAAYEILETYAGCKWYASWHSVIPERDVVAVPEDIDDVQTPSFVMRQPFWYDVSNNRDFAARLRVNGYNHTVGEVDAKYGGDSFRFGGGLGSCHTFNELLPPSVYFEKHPEYFSLVKGKRLNGHTQLCLTNPDVLRIVTSNVLERIRKDPGAKFYGVSQNDWYNYCECETCAAIDKEEESHAGTMLRFVNAVAEAVEKEFPDVIIETLAYQYTRKPPKKTRLRHNVVPCLCSIECDFARPIPESPYAADISFRNDINGWKEQTDQLYVWDYVTDFSSYTMPFANVYALQGNIRFFRDNNVKELFEQGAYQGRHGEFAELKAWLLAKWMWNPELPMKPLLDDFFNGYYGKAAPFIREYFEEMHRRQQVWSADPKKPLRIYGGLSRHSLGSEFIEWAKPLWRSAVEAVKDDPALSYNVRMSEFAFDVLRLECFSPKPQHKEIVFAPSTEDDVRVAEAKDLAKSLLDRMDEAKDMRLSEGIGRHNAYIAEWKSIAYPGTNAVVDAIASQCADVEESRLKLANPGKWGEIVSDPKAGDGKALKLFNTHFEWCVQMSMGKIKFRSGAKYKVRARVRVEKERDGGMAFWAGVYDPAAKRGLGDIHPQTDAIKDSEYAWYDVCTWTPREDGEEYFWIGPGRFGKDGKSFIKSVYLDKIQILLDEPETGKGKASSQSGGVSSGSLYGVPDGHEMWQRPVTLRKGVELKALSIESPRTMKAYLARIDLGEPDIGFTATGRDPLWGEPMPDYTNRTVLIDTKREKTADFMMRRRAEGMPVDVAVNATPWGPWDGTAAYRSTYGALRGWNVSDGVEVSRGKNPKSGAFFVLYKDGRAEIAPSVPPSRTNDVAFALCGFGLVMTNGVHLQSAQSPGGVLAPRTAFGLTADRRTLVLLAVDGRQPGYSLGADMHDLYTILRAEGVTDAVNMDGGGSTSLVVFDGERGKPWMLNHQPMRGQRRNAMNFGISFGRMAGDKPDRQKPDRR